MNLRLPTYIGFINKQNNCYWEDQNPHLTYFETNNQTFGEQSLMWFNFDKLLDSFFLSWNT